jgi:hypothetical protein
MNLCNRAYYQQYYLYVFEVLQSVYHLSGGRLATRFNVLVSIV